MAFRGMFLLDVAGPTSSSFYELANSSRVVDHLRPTTPTSDTGLGGAGCHSQLSVGYDDSWPGLYEYLGGSGDGYTVDTAPWVHAASPQSREFAGVWVMDVQGLDSTPVQRDVVELLGPGGYAEQHRDESRPVTFSALIVGCTNAGARYGLSWLTTALRATRVPGGGTLHYLGAHPSDTMATPLELARELHGVVLTSAPTVVETSGLGGGAQHRQSTVLRVEWEMVATNPHVYRPQTTALLSPPVVETNPIEWVHQADCADTRSCEIPVMYAVGCEPARITVPAAPVPMCGGCVPVCEVERRTWELIAPSSAVLESAATLRVENLGAEPLSVAFYWRPCGADPDDPCAQLHPLQIIGLPAGATAVADSITGRPYAIHAGTRRRQSGIVTTPSGAPWSPAILDTRLGGGELVAEAAPGQAYSVSVVLADRVF